MKIRNIIYALAAITFAACSSESLETQQVPLTINATIDGETTRAEVSSFKVDDIIGVFVGEDIIKGVPFTTTDGVNFKISETSHTAIYFTSEEMAVKAYYPYINSGVESINTADQNNVSDYLYAEGTASIETGTADLEFHHLMSKLTFNITAGEGYEDEDFNIFIIKLSGLKTRGDFIAYKGTVEATDEENELIVQDCWESPATLLVIPQDIESFTLTITTFTPNQNSFSATVPVKSGKLEAGKNYIFTAKVDKEKLTVSSSSVIAGWDKKDPADVNVIHSGD